MISSPGWGSVRKDSGAAYLKLQRRFTGLAEPIVVPLIHGRQVPLSHDMRSHKLADVLAEPETAQVLLAEDLMTFAADVRAVRGDHGGQFLGSWNETADVVEQGAQDGVIVRAGFDGELGGLQ